MDSNTQGATTNPPNILDERLSLYQSGIQSHAPWATITVGDYLLWTQRGEPLPQFRSVGTDEWKKKKGWEVLNKSYNSIKTIRSGEPGEDELPGIKRESLSAVSWGHGQATGKAGYVVDRKSAKKHHPGTRYLCFDIDKITSSEGACQERDRLFGENDSILAAGLSASGRGVWVIFALARPAVGEADYKRLWWWLAAQLVVEHGLPIGVKEKNLDVAPSNMVSLRFFSYDPGLRSRGVEVKLLDVPPPADVPSEQESTAKDGILNTAVKTHEKAIEPDTIPTPTNKPVTAIDSKPPVPDFDERVDWVRNATGGHKDSRWRRCCRATWQDVYEGKTPNEQRINDYADAIDKDRDDVERIINGAIDKQQNKPKPKPKPKPKTPIIENPITVVSTHRPVIDYQTCLSKLGVKIRDHAYLGFEWSSDDGKTWQRYSSGTLDHLYVKVLEQVVVRHIKEVKPANFAKDHRSTAIKSMLFRQKYNPFRDYIENLPTEQCEESTELLKKVFDEDTELKDAETYFADVLLVVIKGLVNRVNQPGCNFPFFALFRGEQGIGKSLFIENLLPPCSRSGFADSFDLSLPPKERDLILRSMALVECSELAGSSGRKAVTEQKVLVTSKSTQHRCAYEPFPEPFIRNAVLFGSTNEEQCIQIDPSGNRRYLLLPIKLKEGWTMDDVETRTPKIIDEWRDRLFSHAKFEIANGRGACSFRHFKTGRAIAESLYDDAEHRNLTVEDSIDRLLDKFPHQLSGEFESDLREWNKWHLLRNEIDNGIPLSLPPSRDGRTIMKLLLAAPHHKRQVQSFHSASFIGRVLRRKGWTPKRSLVGGSKVTLYFPPN